MKNTRLGTVGLSVGALTWLLCAPRLGTLAQVLHWTGAFVASTIWPIAAGLFWLLSLFG